MFDAIICDPPYGTRETVTGAFGENSLLHCKTTEERVMTQREILQPLFLLASRILRVGGRLVFT